MIYYKYDEFGYSLRISALNYIGKTRYIYNYTERLLLDNRYGKDQSNQRTNETNTYNVTQSTLI